MMTINYYPLWQQMLMTIATSIAGLLSLIGSSCIVWHILLHGWKMKKNKPKEETAAATAAAINNSIHNSNDIHVRYRLLLWLSIGDMLNSIMYIVWSLPIPRDTPNIWGAIGNKQTCDVQGFFAQFTGLTPSIYNGALCHYFYVTLVTEGGSGGGRRRTSFYNNTNTSNNTTTFEQKYERYWHIVAWGYPIITAWIALYLDVYSFTSFGCYMAPSPYGCERLHPDVSCERGQNAYIFGWVLAGIPLLTMLGVVAYFMYNIYKHVRDVTLKSERHVFQSSYYSVAARSSNSLMANDQQAQQSSSPSWWPQQLSTIFFTKSSDNMEEERPQQEQSTGEEEVPSARDVYKAILTDFSLVSRTQNTTIPVHTNPPLPDGREIASCDG